MTQKKKVNLDLLLRGILTVILTVIFCVVFFVFDGANFLLGRIGEVKCFASANFEVHFIDVGQGDSSFIRFPDGKNMLIDAGPITSGDGLVNYLKDIFKQEGIEKIDYFLLTHQDRDHIGGAEKILKAFQVDMVYRPSIYCNFEVENLTNEENFEISTNDYYENVIWACYQEPNCKIQFSKAGITLGDSNYSVKFLSPNKNNYSASNDYSPIVKITYGSRSFLFTGDADLSGENEAIANYSPELHSDVLKVGHHGSNTSTSEKFLSYVTPSVAIISVGAHNSYGHPDAETIARLKKFNAQILTTAQKGSMAMTVDDKTNVILGGSNNQPPIDLVIVIVVYALSVLLVWGIRRQNFTKVKNKIKK